MSGNNPDWVKKLKDLFVIDTSDPSKGIQISLPATPAEPAPAAPDIEPLLPASASPVQYKDGIAIVNGRVVREARHVDSDHAGWTYGVGPAPTELEKKPAGGVRRVRQAPVKLDDLEFVIVDTETTGGALTRGHRITEIAIVRVNARGHVLHEYATLVNPGRTIPPMITALTHIDDRMVRNAPRFEDIAHDVRALLDGRVFVAHNASFDWHFISGELGRTIRKPLNGRRLCTVRLARKVVPEIRSRSLDSLSYFFNVYNEARHRAYGDARATARIFRRLMDRVRDRDVETWHDLEQLTQRRSQRRRRTAMPTDMDDA